MKFVRAIVIQMNLHGIEKGKATAFLLLSVIALVSRFVQKSPTEAHE